MSSARFLLFLLFSSITTSFFPPTAAKSNLHPTLYKLRSIWPVPSSPRTLTSSTFGPRIKLSTRAYDFHRGIDISAPEGTPIVAVLDGTLYGVRDYTGGGLTVLIDHSIPKGVLFHDEKRFVMTSFSMHCSSFADGINEENKGKFIKQGDVIAYAGKTGNAAVSSHLHFSIRLGYRWTLAHQLKYNQTSFLHDPAIHPLYLYTASEDPKNTSGISPVTMSVTVPMSKTGVGIVYLETPDIYPAVNRYDLWTERRPSSGRYVRLHTLDLSDRTGFDATSTEAIDTPDTSKPYLSPIFFGKSAVTWRMEYFIPPCFGKKKRNANVKLCVTDVADRVACIVVASGRKGWNSRSCRAS